jgi:glucose-6-phosphate isomerase
MKFNYKQTANIKESDVTKIGKKLEPYLEELNAISEDSAYAKDESPLYLPHDDALRKQVLRLVREKQSKKLKEVMVVGIGGSNLGTWAVYDALRPEGATLSFFDTAHIRILNEACERMQEIYQEGGEVLINFISKSGSTNETVMNARVLIHALRENSDEWKNQVVVTTEPESKLDMWANENEIASLPNPKHVGGRYSIMSAVGLFPLALAGVNIKKLHKGASYMQKLCLTSSADVNPALQSTAAIYTAMKAKAVIHNLFVFNMDLERVGKWYRQLVGESLGKEKNLNGKVVHAGITPMVTIGSTDLHSVAQLLLGGPKDKITTFVRIHQKEDIDIPTIDAELDDIVPELNHQTVGEVMDAIYEGTVQAYRKRKLPYVEVVLEKLNEEELGAFLQFKMVETMLLGKLMNVNAFDQPNVEEYKKITRKILSE